MLSSLLASTKDDTRAAAATLYELLTGRTLWSVLVAMWDSYRAENPGAEEEMDDFWQKFTTIHESEEEPERWLRMYRIAAAELLERISVDDVSYAGCPALDL